MSIDARDPLHKGDVLDRIRADVERLGTQKAVAEAMGIHPSYLGDVLKGVRDPGPAILRFYGLVERSVYVPDEAGK